MKRYLVIASVASLQWLLAPFGAAQETEGDDVFELSPFTVD